MDFKPRQHPRGYQWHAVGQAEARTRVQSPGQVPPHRFEVPSTPHCRHQRWQGPGCHVVSFLEYFPTSFFFFFLKCCCFQLYIYNTGIRLFSRTDISPPTKLYKCPFPRKFYTTWQAPVPPLHLSSTQVGPSFTQTGPSPQPQKPLGSPASTKKGLWEKGLWDRKSCSSSALHRQPPGALQVTGLAGQAASSLPSPVPSTKHQSSCSMETDPQDQADLLLRSQHPSVWGCESSCTKKADPRSTTPWLGPHPFNFCKWATLVLFY